MLERQRGSRVRMRRWVWTGVGVTCAALVAVSASAQSYIAGAVAAEVVRTTTSKSGNSTYDNGSGEVAAGAIRVGSSVTDRFGVELEFYRPGEIKTSMDAPIYYASGLSY